MFAPVTDKGPLRASYGRMFRFLFLPLPAHTCQGKKNIDSVKATWYFKLSLNDTSFIIGSNRVVAVFLRAAKNE